MICWYFSCHVLHFTFLIVFIEVYMVVCGLARVQLLSLVYLLLVELSIKLKAVLFTCTECEF